jgi:hypothetical protein
MDDKVILIVGDETDVPFSFNFSNDVNTQHFQTRTVNKLHAKRIQNMKPEKLLIIIII